MDKVTISDEQGEEKREKLESGVREHAKNWKVAFLNMSSTFIQIWQPIQRND